MSNFPAENPTPYSHENFTFVPPFEWIDKTDDHSINWRTIDVVPTGPTSSISILELTYDEKRSVPRPEIYTYRLNIPN